MVLSSERVKEVRHKENILAERAVDRINTIMDKAADVLVETLGSVKVIQHHPRGPLDEKLGPANLMPESPKKATGRSVLAGSAVSEVTASTATTTRENKDLGVFKEARRSAEITRSPDISIVYSPKPETSYPGKKKHLVVKRGEKVFKEVNGSQLLIVRELQNGQKIRPSIEGPNPRLLAVLKNKSAEKEEKEETPIESTIQATSGNDIFVSKNEKTKASEMRADWGIDTTIKIVDSTGKQHKLKISSMYNAETGGTSVVLQDRPICWTPGITEIRKHRMAFGRGKKKVEDVDQGKEKVDESLGKSSDKEKEEDELAAPRASIARIYKYGTWLDILMVLVGIGVAVVTGLGMPFLSIVIGDVSEAFIDMREAQQSNLSKIEYDDRIDSFQHKVIVACVKYTVIGLIIMTCAFVQTVCFLVSCENICNRIRRDFFKAIMRQDITWYDKNHSGTLATKLFDAMERVKEGLGDKMGMMVQFTSQFFGGLIVAMAYDWRLTLIMMSLSPLLIICGLFIAKLMASSTAEEMKKYSIAGKIAEEVLTSVRTVFAFNGQYIECERYDKALQAGKLDGYKKSIYIGVGLAVTMAVLFSSYCLAFWVGTDYIYWDMASSSTVLTVFFSVMMGSMAMGQAGQQFGVFGTALGAAGVVLQVIDREPEIDSYSTEGQKIERVRGEVTIDGLEFTYPTRKDVPILKGVSIACNPGETVALVGSSGCGKSTIVQLLLRYYNPDNGSIKIDGVPIQDLNIEFLRRTIGVVSQEPSLFNATILENLRYGNPNASDAEIQSALRRANAANFIAAFPQGLNTLVGDRGAQMSGGQKQRIAIARALLRDPRILLLDEATSALDAESEAVVQEALENASRGRTTIVIAHRLSTIKNADRIIAMKEGRVVEMGTHDELLERKGLYHELVNAQVFADVEDTKKGKKKLAGRQISRSSRRRTSTGSGGSMKGNDDEEELEEVEKIPENEKDIDRLKREAKEEGAQEANLFKILKYAKPEWWLLVLGTIACIIQGVVFPAFSLFFTQIMQVFSEPDKAKLRKDGHMWSLMFLLLAAVEALTMLFQATFYGIAAERLTMRLRSKVFRNILRQDGAYFDHPSHSPGKISTRLASDAPNVKSAIDYRLGSVFNALVGVTAGIAIGFYYSWQMALLMLALFPLMGIGEALQIKMLEGKSGEDTKELETAGKIAMEAVEHIRTVQALTLEKTLHQKFCDHLDGPHRSSFVKALLQGVTFAIGNSLMFYIFAAEFRFGGWLITANHVSNPIDVLRVLFAIQFSATSIGFASAYFPEYAKAKFAAGLIFKMLGEKPQIDNMSKGGKFPQITGAVRFNDIRFRYPQRDQIEVLKGLSLEVNPGQTLALVGSSGCGKSTVVSLLERFYDPNTGVVEVDGENIREVNPVHLRKHIALVSQEPILFDCSVKENIVYGLPQNSVTDAEIVEAARKANIHKFVSELPDGYDTRVGDKGTQLSGGQKQRVAIARALIRNPKILLLDEATSALDTESEKLVQDALDAASKGRTCIVIAHRLSTVVNAHRIMVVSGGFMVEEGTHQELMAKKGAYFQLTLKQQNRGQDAEEAIEEEFNPMEKF
ncbi:unnamed protein product, partial [Mesorhabditis belari]|uniref:ABC-type xenobiotic transporter n=1 Tax=Mesorhabditis belari TaxID=2138241 RepID=A0AAF3FJV7_9BILA